MGGKRGRWIYFQLGQLSLLAIAAFVAAIAVALPAGTNKALRLSVLAAADISVMVWIPSLALWLLTKRTRGSRPLRDEREWRMLILTRSQPPERRVEAYERAVKRCKRRVLRELRDDRYKRFPVLFVVCASAILAGFYGLLRDPVALKTRYPDFGVDAEFLLPFAALALMFGIAVGGALHNRTAFLVLFAAIGLSSLHMICTREWFIDPVAAWRDIEAIAYRFACIGTFATGIAAGIFAREVIRYRRRNARHCAQAQPTTEKSPAR